jgi:Fic family protein
MEPFVPEELPIKKVQWEPLIPLIGTANRSIAQYEGVLYGVPNPEVLLSPLTTQEAVLSSKIEGTQATLGEVLKFEAGEKPEEEARRQDIHEIINYRRALSAAEQELKNPTVQRFAKVSTRAPVAARKRIAALLANPEPAPPSPQW